MLQVKVYHGERDGGSGFTRGRMLYLSPSRTTADHYSRVNKRGEVETVSGRVHELLLTLEKPLDLRPLGKTTTRDDFNDFLERQGLSYVFGSNAPDRGPVWMYFRYDPMRGELVTGFVDYLIREDYDGLILFDDSSTYGDMSGLTYVAFSKDSVTPVQESAARAVVETLISSTS